MRVLLSYYGLLFGFLAILKSSETNAQTLYVDEKFCQLLGDMVDCSNVDARKYAEVKFNFRADGATSLHFGNSYLQLAPEGIFEMIPDIVELGLDSVHLQNLPPGMFKNAKKLKLINLQHNDIQMIPDGIFRDAPNLNNIRIYDNNLTSVSRDTFAGITAPEVNLFLENNQIQEIHPDAFLGIDIYWLYLSNNKLTSASLDFLKPIDPIYVSINDNCLGDLPVTTLARKQKLTYLLLANTCLANFTSLYGALPPTLQRLDLSGLDLRNLDSAFFISTPILKDLSIKKTNIKAKTVTEIIELLKLEYIDIENNFNCTDLARVVMAAKKAKIYYFAEEPVYDETNVDGIPCSM